MPEDFDLKTAWEKKDGELNAFIAKANEELKSAGNVATETKSALDKLSTEAKSLIDRLFGIEQKLSTPGGIPGTVQQKSVGQTVVESDNFKSMKASGFSRSGQIPIGGMFSGTKDIISGTGGTTQALVAPQFAPFVPVITRRLTIRDLLAQGRTTSNLILYAKENVFTNAAAPIYTPAVTGPPAVAASFEGVLKPKSNITFTQASAPVQTIGHWLLASKQILDDSTMLQDYIDTRLRYGLKLVEETQLLTGDGSGANLNGLITQATAYDDTTITVAGQQMADKIRKAMLQVRKVEMQATGIVMNPTDWATIELLKTTGTASSGQYLFANPHGLMMPTLWGLPVVDTNSIPVGRVLVGDFQQGAQIWDRQDATVEISREDQDNFVRNMVTILCEERLALTVYRPTAFVYI